MERDLLCTSAAERMINILFNRRLADSDFDPRIVYVYVAKRYTILVAASRYSITSTLHPNFV